MENAVQADAVEAPFRGKPEAEVAPPRLDAHEDLQGQAGKLYGLARAAAVVFKGKEAVLPHGGEDGKQRLVLQRMYHKIMLPAEKIVGGVFPIQDGASDDSKGGGLRAEFHGVQKPAVKRRTLLQGQRAAKPPGKRAPLLLRLKDPQPLVFPAFEADKLGVQRLAVAQRNLIRKLRRGPGLPVRQQIQEKEMEQKIPVREAFGLPGRVERVRENLLAVHADGYLLAFGGVIGMHIRRQIILDPPPFIVIGAAALLAEFPPDLEAIEKKLAHIVPDAVKIFDELLKNGHEGPPFLTIDLHNYSIKRPPGKDRTFF